MADLDSKWNQNIDKIGYAVAGFLGLVVLCVPFVLGGPVKSNELMSSIGDVKNQVEKDKGRYPKIDPEKDLAVEAKKQWTPGPASAPDPAWATERDPVLVRLVQSVAGEDCKHLPGQLTEIACVRDAKRKAANLVVKGGPSPDNQGVVIKKMELLRKEGEGEWKPLPAFKQTGEFTFADETVEPGKKYTYKLVTTAARDPKAPEHYKFDKTPPTQESNELGTGDNEVPPDFSLVVLGFDSNDPTKFMGKESHFDYKADKPVGGTVSALFKEKDLIGERFEVFRVDSNSGEVTIKDREKSNAKFTFSIKGAKTPKAIASWEPITPGGGEAPKEEEPAPPPKGKAAAKPAPKAPEKAAEKSAEKKTDSKAATKTKASSKKIK